MRSIFFILFFLPGEIFLRAQNMQAIDSLNALAGKEPTDTGKATLYNHLANEYRFHDVKMQMDYAKKALNISKQNNFIPGEANAYNMLGSAMENTGRFDAALNYYDSSLAKWTSVNSVYNEAKLNLNVANVYVSKTDYHSASEYAIRSLKQQESVHNNFGVAVSNLTLGNISYNQGDVNSALDYYEIAYRLNKASKKNIEVSAVALGNIGGMFISLKQYDSALYYYRLSAGDFINAGMYLRLGSNYDNLGTVWKDKGNTDSALWYFRHALSLDYKYDNAVSACKALRSIGGLYEDGNMPDSSIFYFNKSLAISTKLKTLDDELGVLYELSNDYEMKKDLASALRYARRYTELSDSLHDAEKAGVVEQLKMVNELDKKDHDLQIAQERQKVSEARQKVSDEKYQRNVIVFSFMGIVGVIIVVVLLIMYRLKRKNNSLLEKKNEEISAQKNEMMSSIQYAKRIQEAIFPPKELKYKLFPDAFVLLLPRDIVSGDFYWFAEKNGKKFMAAVDCTGHGVPGAFMSMIGNAFLNEIVLEKGITSAGKILDELRGMIIASLKQKGQEEESKDGMDLALLVFDEKNNSAEFAGANNPLWICRNGSMSMEEIKGDKQPIGFYSGEAKPFLSHRINLGKGDALYVFTDGYADQFGGQLGKKFRYKPLQELFINVSAEPMRMQEKILLGTFEKWKGNLEQVDDVLVIGVRV
ncbi:MAG: SpoIIE family protein phosphatase [Bacteroidetes bacterium]|nr:SpoIIE family protein phosphatase [Bacteroidota bacterium]